MYNITSLSALEKIILIVKQNYILFSSCKFYVQNVFQLNKVKKHLYLLEILELRYTFRKLFNAFLLGLCLDAVTLIVNIYKENT